MNVLFLTMNVFTDIEMHNIYSDLMKEFIRHGHRPYIVTPREKKMNQPTELISFEKYNLLKVQTGNISSSSLIEKGISTVTLSKKYYKAIMKYLENIKFDLILYSTPPITLVKPVKKLKKKLNCKTYLMLKDIFPQNAIDLEMFSKMSPIYIYFRIKEKALYRISDYIGCMSPANVDYILEHNPYIDKEKVMVCPNGIDPIDVSVTDDSKVKIREKYSIPLNKKVFVYGGNLGKPQGIPFLIECLKSQKENDKVFFLIVGDGTEYGKIEKYLNYEEQKNVMLLKKLPKEDYDRIIVSCDIGMIFLDRRFTIPNFPSRLLSYMQVGLPILAVTDQNTDVGNVIVEGGFGWWCGSDDLKGFCNAIDIICKSNQLDQYGYNSNCYLKKNYSVDCVYKKIMLSFKKEAYEYE